jgi:hypothetical protein
MIALIKRNYFLHIDLMTLELQRKNLLNKFKNTQVIVSMTYYYELVCLKFK